MAQLAVVIVADDLTGALDAAGPFANRGHATWVAVDHRHADPARFAGAEVLSVNATSRHLPAAAAAALVQGTVERLRPAGAPVLIKKIDSTLRGNVAVEARAALQASGRRRLVVAPAFPAQGRTVSGGVVHVHGVPLAQTAFARDALSPPPLEPLDRAFQAAMPGARVRVVPPQGPFDAAATDAASVYVVDSAADDDLRATIAALRPVLAECVFVGSAGIARAIAQEVTGARAHAPRPGLQGEMLVVVGSRAEQSAQQVEALAAQGNAALFRAPDGALGLGAVLRDHSPVTILRATTGQGPPMAAAQVACRLAAGALRVLEARPIGAVLATGGDTAIALLEALHVPALQVMGDLLPGIPYARVEACGRSVWLVTKAGGFGRPDTMVEVLNRLRTGEAAAPGGTSGSGRPA
jgi:uncharacterized protein YgbK (DUF1537 family)